MPSLRRIRALSASDWLAFGHALVLLPTLGAWLRLSAHTAVHERLDRWAPARPGAGSDQLATARGVARMVNVAARRGIWRANCLERSLATWWLLRRRSINADLRFGVRPDPSGPKFHAWLELGDDVVNDRPDVAELYRTFEQPIEPPRKAKFD